MHGGAQRSDENQQFLMADEDVAAALAGGSGGNDVELSDLDPAVLAMLSEKLVFKVKRECPELVDISCDVK